MLAVRATDASARFQMVSQQSVVCPDTVPKKFHLRRGKTLTLTSRTRYLSILLLTVSNSGYFYHGFSFATCTKYYMVAPVLKGKVSLGSGQQVLTHRMSVVQIMVSQAIVGYRTWNIARRSNKMGAFLLTFGVIITVFEWYSNVDARIPVQSDVSTPS